MAEREDPTITGRSQAEIAAMAGQQVEGGPLSLLGGHRFSDLVDRDRGRLAVVSEADCRKAIVAFMTDWNKFPAEQCAWKMFDRLKKLARETVPSGQIK